MIWIGNPATLRAMLRFRPSLSIRKAVRRALGGLAILWIAVFYPTVCEIHGMMLFRYTEMPSHDMADSCGRHREMGTMGMAMEMSPVEPDFAPEIASGDKLGAVRFHGVPVGSTVMAMAAMYLAPALSFCAPNPTAEFAAVATFGGHQQFLAPPDQPPRTTA